MQTIDLTFARELLPQLMAVLPILMGIMLGAFLLSFATTRAIRLVARRTNLTALDVAPLCRVLRWLIWGIALVLMLSVLGFNLSGLWAVLSTILAMIAIGFVAVWSVLSNVSCTVIMLIARPFQIGDEIEFAGEPIVGRVVDLNFVYTTLKGEDGRLLQIPNNLFFQKVIKRRPNPVDVTLAAQLSSRQPADVPVVPKSITADAGVQPTR